MSLDELCTLGTPRDYLRPTDVVHPDHREVRARLRVIGPFRGVSGYDRHTRALVRQFVRGGVAVQLVNLPGWSRPLPEAARDSWFDTLAALVDAETVLHFTMPTQMQPHRGKCNVNYSMFEADRIPASWASCSTRSDGIVVPTESSRHGWRAACQKPRFALRRSVSTGRFSLRPASHSISASALGLSVRTGIAS